MSNLLRWLNKEKNQENKEPSEFEELLKKAKKLSTSTFSEHVEILLGKKLPGMFYSGNYFWNLKESLRYERTGWDRSLLWCPSQLHKYKKYGKWNVTLYARWRWSDPWTGNIIVNRYPLELHHALLDHWVVKDESGPYFVDVGKNLWSQDVLESYNFSESTPIKVVERALEHEYEKYFVRKEALLSFRSYK